MFRFKDWTENGRKKRAKENILKTARKPRDLLLKTCLKDYKKWLLESKIQRNPVWLNYFLYGTKLHKTCTR